MAVNVVVAPAAEPTAVEACLNDELARAAAELPSLIGGKPVARLIDFTDAGQVWSCGVQVADVEAQGPAGHELRKRLLARLRREGIALGVPARLSAKYHFQADARGQSPARDAMAPLPAFRRTTEQSAPGGPEVTRPTTDLTR